MTERSRETSTVPRRGESVETKLLRIAKKARSEPKFQFTSLYHLLNEELLRGSFAELRKNAAAGIDGMTKEMYAEGLEERLTDLVDRLQRMAYVPEPVRRRYIPKPGTNKQRPLGVPTLESKLVEAGLVRILEQIYERDFIEDSYGFRPGRSCHTALRALSQTVEGGRINWIVEADIKGSFDNVRHDILFAKVATRVQDREILHLLKLIVKPTGKRSAGNPHAAFDEAGAGNGVHYGHCASSRPYLKGRGWKRAFRYRASPLPASRSG